MISTYDEIMAESTDEELVKTVYLEPYNYRLDALSAAKAALASRKLSESEIERLKQKIQRKILNDIKRSERWSFKRTFWHMFLPFGLGLIITAAIDKYSEDDESE